MADIRQLLLAAFEVEHREHIEAIRAALGAAGGERTPDWNDVFRRAHSLKGAARAVDLPAVEALAHRLEALFERVRTGAPLNREAANATHLMRCAEGPDPYQLRLGDLGRLDLVHLGMGPDGHTASLFPGTAALDVTDRLVVLNEPKLEPFVERMTFTFPALATARHVVVTIEGEGKLDAWRKVRSGADLPAGRVTAERVTYLVGRELAV